MCRRLRLGFGAPKNRRCIGHWPLVLVLPAVISQVYDMIGSVYHLITTVFLKISDRYLHVSKHLCCLPVDSIYSMFFSTFVSELKLSCLQEFSCFREVCGVAVFQQPREVWKQDCHSATALVIIFFIPLVVIFWRDCCKIWILLNPYSLSLKPRCYF